MKWLVWLLLLVNVALFGYFKLQPGQHAESMAGHELITPEKLRILTPEQLAALPKKSQEPVTPPSAGAETAPIQYACYQWSGLLSNDVSRAKNVLAKYALDVSIREQAVPDGASYWVYIPPRKSLEEAKAKIGELKALGVQESFIVQEPQWRYAVSLGVFKDEALANQHLENLRKRGVKSALKGPRNHDGGQSSLFLRNVSTTMAEEIARLKSDFSGSELKQTPCQ
jgi:hypothetical protein